MSSFGQQSLLRGGARTHGGASAAAAPGKRTLVDSAYGGPDADETGEDKRAAGYAAVSGTMRRLTDSTSLFRKKESAFLEMPGYFFHGGKDSEIVRDATPADGSTSPSGGYSFVVGEAGLAGWVPTALLTDPVGSSPEAGAPPSTGSTFDVTVGTLYRSLYTVDLRSAAGQTASTTGAKLLQSEFAQTVSSQAVQVDKVAWLNVKLPRADGTAGWVPQGALAPYQTGLEGGGANGVWMGGYKFTGPAGTAPRTHDDAGANVGLGAATQMPGDAAVEVLSDPATRKPIPQPSGEDFWYVRNAAKVDVCGWYEARWITGGGAGATGGEQSVADEIKTVFPNGFPVCFVVHYQKQSDTDDESVGTFFHEASSYAQRYRAVALSGGQVVLGAPNIIHGAQDITAIMYGIHTALRASTAAQGVQDIPLWVKASSVAIFAHGGPSGMSLGDDAGQASANAAADWKRYHEIWRQLNADSRLPKGSPDKMTPAQRQALQAEAEKLFNGPNIQGDFKGDLYSGGGENGVQAFTHNLAAFVTGDVKVSLFACSTGDGGAKEQNWATPAADKPTGGEGTFADKFADGLGEGGATGSTVLGHTTVGPTVRNADARLFTPGDGGTGGENYFNFCYDEMLASIKFQWVDINADYVRQLVFNFYTETVDGDSVLARRMALDPEGFKLDVQAKTRTWIDSTLRPMVDIPEGTPLWSVRSYDYNADLTGTAQIPSKEPVTAAVGPDGFVVRFEGSPWYDSLDALRSYAWVTVKVPRSDQVFKIWLPMFKPLSSP